MSRALREAISHTFSIDDIRTLCFDLQIDYESLAGEGKDAKIRELLIKCRQQGRWDELLTLKQTRSHLDWEEKLPIADPVTPSDPATNIFESPEQLLGTSIGAYNLMEFIGAGGSGLVFRATHAKLGKEAALKLFYPLASEFDSFYDRFRQGFRAIGALDHPHVVKIIDFDETWVNGLKTFYLVMEFVSGVDLEMWSAGLQGDAMALQKRLKMAIQIAKALQAAHETTYTDQVGVEVRGVLHGDLKPANILVTSRDEPKLLDFLLVDIQRLLDPDVVPAHVLRMLEMDRGPVPITGVMGTPGFMAPEQEAEGIITTKTDIYSLGVTFIHLFGPHDSTFDLMQSGPRELVTLLFENKLTGPANSRLNIQEVVQILESMIDGPAASADTASHQAADILADEKSGVLGKLKKWFK
jgi:serine/threonine protein kinase